jgi:uncharacterized protein YkwD
MRYGVAALAAALCALIFTGCGAAVGALANSGDLQNLADQIRGGQQTQTPSTPSGSVSSPSTGGATLTDMIALHNATRTQLGLKTLRQNSQLMIVAQKQAQYIASIGSLTHQDGAGRSIGARMTASGYQWTTCGENIAYAGTSARAYSGWLGSPGHYKNITNSAFRDIGVAVVKVGGREYWCAVFGAP